MTKLNNPFIGIEDYNCFGCAPDNEHGLRMEFHEDGDEVVSFWDAPSYFQGYNYILHGGIRASLIDELASWVVFVKLKTAGYTTKLEVNYASPVYSGRGKIELRGKLKEVNRNIAVIEVGIKNEKGEIATSGVAEYFTLPEKIAIKKMGYPGVDAFYSV
ncbi:MAG: PaaI family thioesterase [Spirochaetales bacterium]|nr:PaaI family thioesterase [Spirochaetales bacterium]